MQSLTQKMTTTAILLVFFLASAHADDPAAAVPSPFSLRPSPATFQFAKAYAQAVRDHGTAGLKPLAAPDFTLRGSGLPLTGPAALKGLDSIAMPGCSSVAIHPLSVTATDAVILSQETYAFSMKIQHHGVLSSVIFDWKQTWRETPQGWKLTRIQEWQGDFAHLEGVTYTVLTDAQIEPAKAQEKQNMVK